MVIVFGIWHVHTPDATSKVPTLISTTFVSSQKPNTFPFSPQDKLRQPIEQSQKTSGIMLLFQRARSQKHKSRSVASFRASEKVFQRPSPRSPSRISTQASRFCSVVSHAATYIPAMHSDELGKAFRKLPPAARSQRPKMLQQPLPYSSSISFSSFSLSASCLGRCVRVVSVSNFSTIPRNHMTTSTCSCERAPRCQVLAPQTRAPNSTCRRTHPQSTHHYQR